MNGRIEFNVSAKIYPEVYPKGKINIIGINGNVTTDPINGVITYDSNGLFYVKRGYSILKVTNSMIQKSTIYPITWTNV